MDAKGKMVEQLIAKLHKRSLELAKDAARLNGVNLKEAALDLDAAKELMNSAISRLSK